MQNKLLAPRAGVVKSVKAKVSKWKDYDVLMIAGWNGSDSRGLMCMFFPLKVGDTVEGEQVIIEFEPMKEGDAETSKAWKGPGLEKLRTLEGGRERKWMRERERRIAPHMR